MSKELYIKAQEEKLSLKEKKEAAQYILNNPFSDFLLNQHIDVIIKIAKNNPYLVKYFHFNKKISNEEKFYICKELLNHNVTIFNLVTTKLNIDLQEPISYIAYDDTKPNNKKKVELLDEIFEQSEATILEQIKKLEKTKMPFNDYTVGTLLNNSLGENKTKIFYYINDKYEYDFKLNPDLIFLAINCSDYKNIIDICLNKGLTVHETTHNIDEISPKLLCWAAMENYDALTYLIEKGGDVNTQGFKNYPLIIYVALSNTEKLYDFYINFRPCLDIKISEYETARDFLTENNPNNKNIIEQYNKIKSFLDYEKINNTNTFKNQKNTSKKTIL